MYFLQVSTLCFFYYERISLWFSCIFGLVFCCFCCLFSVRCLWLIVGKRLVVAVSVIVFARRRLCMCLLLLLLRIFRCSVLFHWIMFAKLLDLIFVSVYYNSLITTNVLEIFVGIDDIPLLVIMSLTIVPAFIHYLQCASLAATRGQRRFCLAATSANSSRRSRDGRRQHFKGTTQGVRLQGDVISPKMSYNHLLQCASETNSSPTAWASNFHLIIHIDNPSFSGQAFATPSMHRLSSLTVVRAR